MPLPTEAALQAAIGYRIKLDKILYDFLAVTATTWLTREATYLAAIPTDSSPGAQAAQATLRKLLADASVQLANGCAPLWSTYAQLAALRPNEDFWRELRRYFVANSLTVKYRNITFGSVSAVTGSGTGTVNRLTVDQDNFNIESCFAEAKVAECIRDANNGAPRHGEIFRVRGAPAGKDALELVGTGRFVDVETLSPRSSANIVKNPSFEAFTLNTYPAISALTNWTAVTNITNFQIEYGTSSNIYKDNPDAATSASLRFLGNDGIYQTFSDMLLRWDPNVPLYAQIAFKRESSCDGNLNIQIGNKTTTVALAAQVGWTIHRWKLDKDSWYLNWKIAAAATTSAFVKISLDSRTTGTLLVDDFTIGPMTQVDGTYIAIVGGATPFLHRDSLTWTDSSADTGVIQTHLARRYGQYLPYTSGSPTWADP